MEAGRNIEKTETGIIFLDEFDKLARKSETSNMTTNDPGHEGVQQALLKLIEGTEVTFNPGSGRKNPDAEMIRVDTTNILFVCGGAFDGIEKIIDKRLSKANGFGFTAEDIGAEEAGEEDEAIRYNRLIDNATVEDVKKYGIIGELMGRLPIMCKLHQLTEDDLVHILKEPKNAIIKQYGVLFQMDNCGLHFDGDSIHEIAKRAIATKTGARSLRTIVENLLLKTMYELPEIAEKAPEGTKPIINITKKAMDNGNDFEVKYQKIAA